MRCPKCGKKLDANASVCPVCKTKAEAQAVSSVPNHMGQLEYHRAGNFPNTTNSPAQSPVPPAPNNTVNTGGTPNVAPPPAPAPNFVPPAPNNTANTGGTPNVAPPPAPAPVFTPPQPAPNQFTQPPQQHGKFCPTCGAVMNPNSTFCSRCGASIQNSKIKSNTGGVKLSNINYLVYALIGSNLILAFTSLIGYVSKYFDPASAHGSHTEAYSFWYLSSSVWRSREKYKLYKESLNRLGYSSSDKSYFWPIFSIIIMYISIAVCAVFVVIALYKAYSTINNNNKSNIQILKPLRIASIMAIIQLISMIVLKGNADISDLSLTVWFWLFAILAGFSLIAEIFLIKADSTSSKGTV